MKLSAKQTEAIIWAMFGIENEIEHLKYLLVSTDNEENEKFLLKQLETRGVHFKALKDALEGKFEE
jgi:hypothetical protein